MSGGGHGEGEFVGWRKNFNTVTHRGRLNMGLISMGFWTTVFLAIKLWPSKSKDPRAIKH